MPQCIVGWDIGGAHVKAALIKPEGTVLKVFQAPCPLWKGIEFLNQAVEYISAEITEKDCQHVVTMTGELVDLFESRDHGVMQIIQVMQEKLGDRQVFIYAGLEGFLTVDKVEQRHCVAIASANWLASASLAAKQVNSGLFLDIGSTTTDILVLAEDKVRAVGMTDYERLVSEELVYTGIIRTAVMAVAQMAHFKGQLMGLMAEYFATMADVYRLTGELNEAHDQTDTADGADKTIVASSKRLSRMTGYEYLEGDAVLWTQFAQDIKAQQKNKIKKAVEKHLSRGLLSRHDSFIGAGAGRFLVKQLAEELEYPYVDFSELIQQQSNKLEIDSADCAPAVSVALLYAQSNSHQNS